MRGDFVEGIDDRPPHAVAIRDDVVERRPAFGDLGMRVTARGVVHVGIDAAIEHVVEAGIERRALKDSAADVVPRECREMAHVEDERVPQGDGA